MNMTRDKLEEAANYFKVFGNGTRLGIILALMESPLHVGPLADKLDLSQGSVSQQLKTLRHLGIVEARRDGQQVLYSIKDPNIKYIVKCFGLPSTA